MTTFLLAVIAWTMLIHILVYHATECQSLSSDKVVKSTHQPVMNFQICTLSLYSHAYPAIFCHFKLLLTRVIQPDTIYSSICYLYIISNEVNFTFDKRTLYLIVWVLVAKKIPFVYFNFQAKIDFFSRF